MRIRWIVRLAVLALLAATAQAETGGEAMTVVKKTLPGQRTSATAKPEPETAISLALKDGKFYLGEVASKIAGEAPVKVDKAAFLDLCRPLLKPGFVAALSNSPQDGDDLPLAAIRRAGLKIDFNGNELALVLTPVIEQRIGGSLHLAEPAEAVPDAALTKPASVSGFTNLRAGIAYQHNGWDRGFSEANLSASSALRVLNLVIENEAAIFPGGAFRQGTRVIYDDAGRALRYAAGDVTPPVTGLQTGAGLAGLSVQKSYSTLQPQKNVRPTGRRTFRLERPSQVDIVVNGQVVRRLQLPPGDFDISELPLRAGENLLKLEITDDTGARTTLDFSVFFDHTLLAEGIDEWGVSAGFRSLVTTMGPVYDTGAPAATGFYRRGLAEDLTAILHGQADSRTAMAGVGLSHRSAYGSFAAEAGMSYGADGVAG